MHILATFATLCCQTRWPRNHSCTTQEHVSFFRDIFGHFRKFRLFRHFRQIWQKPSKTEKTRKTHFHKLAHVRKMFSQICTCRKTFCTNLHMSKNLSCTNLTNVQMCKKPSCTKCANLQRKLFSKCRNHKSALCTKTQMQISAHEQFCLCN